jgi:hypothetical protein
LSGLQLDPNGKFKNGGNSVNCLGPHVGSYRNKLFKRFLYESKIPIIICMTADKINRDIDSELCHFVLDKEFSWETFYTDHPVAFCVGCGKNIYDDTVSHFTNKNALGFDIIHSNSPQEHQAFIARNQKFIEQFEKPIGFENKS